MEDLVLDTSALSNLDSDRQSLDAFTDALRRKDLRLVIPYLTLAEALSQQDPNKAKKRSETVLTLFGRHEGQCIVGGDLDAIISIELRRRGSHLKRTPRLRDRDASRLFDAMTNPRFHQYHSRVADELGRFLRKQEHLEHDRALRDEIAAKFSKPKEGALDADMRHLTESALRDSPFINRWTKSKRQQRGILREPAKRPCIAAWCVLAYLNGLGNVYATFNFGRHSDVLAGPKRDKWVDAAISATGTYARWFLTDDRRQARRLEFVADKLGLPVEPCALSEFLGAATR
jgi:hypothetical protein